MLFSGKAAIIMSSEMVYYTGLALSGFSVLIAAIIIPALLLTGSWLRKQLNAEYGESNRHDKR